MPGCLNRWMPRRAARDALVRLQVAVHHPPRVEVRHGGRNVAGDGEHACEIERAPLRLLPSSSSSSFSSSSAAAAACAVEGSVERPAAHEFCDDARARREGGGQEAHHARVGPGGTDELVQNKKQKNKRNAQRGKDA